MTIAGIGSRQASGHIRDNRESRALVAVAPVKPTDRPQSDRPRDDRPASTAPFLALYFDHLGFSPARIGELVAIPMLMRCIAPNLWGWLGDRSGQRLLIVRLGALSTLATFSLIS